MVVGPVHGRTHQIGRAGVHAHIFLVGVLEVEYPGHKAAVGTQHIPPQLGVDGHISHSRGDQDLLKLPAHSLADGGDVVGGLVGAVGDPYAAGEVDKAHVAAGLTLQIRRQAEENAGQGRVVVIGNGV